MANAVLFAAVLLAATAGIYATYGGHGKKTKLPPQPGGPPKWVGISCTATAYFDMGGVRGSIQFYQGNPNEPVRIHVNLNGLDQFNDRYPWHVHDFPVRFGLLRDFPCSAEEVGGHYDPTGVGNSPNYTEMCAADPDNCEVGDFGGKLGRLVNNEPWQNFEDPRVSLFGPQSIVGRSIVIHRQGQPGENARRWVCANIEYNGVRLITMRAPFQNGPLQGDIIFRRVEGRAETTISVDLYRIDNGTQNSMNHIWNLRVGDCGTLGHVYGSMTWSDELDAFERCSPEFQRECFIGDLSAKCGPLNLVGGRMRAFCTDEQLGTVPLSSLRSLSVAIQDADSSENIIACANFQDIEPECALVEFRTRGRRGIYGNLLFYQNDPNDRTFVRTYVTGLRQISGSFEIREEPVPEDGNCSNVGGIIVRPGAAPVIGVPVPSDGIQTGDTVLLGNLGPKLTIPEGAQSYIETVSSSYLPLFGPYNITGDSLVLVRDDTGQPWACGTIRRWHPFPQNLIASISGYQESTKK